VISKSSIYATQTPWDRQNILMHEFDIDKLQLPEAFFQLPNTLHGINIQEAKLILH